MIRGGNVKCKSVFMTLEECRIVPIKKIVGQKDRKGEEMNNKRVVSLGTNSMIYHKPGCRYEYMIKNRNRMYLARYDARGEGYHVCKYCNSMDHHYRTEMSTIDFYSRVKKMQFNYIDGILYVKTDIGCWKLVYSRKKEKIALYHKNDSDKEVDFSNPQNENYHRQEDKPYAYSIAGYLDYIYEHDRYKAAIERGEEVTKFSKKKYARHEAKAKRKREISRVDYLFRMLERDNDGLKALSVC